MADAIVARSSIVIPEVLGDVINNWLTKHPGLYGSPAVRQINSAVWDNGGDSVSFMKRTHSFTAGTLPLDGSAGPDAGAFTMSKVSIACKNKIIKCILTGTAIEDVIGSGNDLEQGVMEAVIEELQRDIDVSLIAAAETTSLVYDGTADTITEAAINNTKALFGDNCTEKMYAIMSSKVYTDLKNLSSVKSYNVFGAPVAQTGLVETLGGCEIIVSNNTTINTTPDPDTYNTLIVREGALLFGFRRDVRHKVVPLPDDKDLHEFSTRYLAYLDSKNGRPMAAVLTTK